MATCASCSKPLVSPNPRARYCGVTCRANASKARSRGIPEARPSAVTALPVATAVFADGSCAAATLTELTAAGRESSALGRAALALAGRIDAQADTGSALASAVKQLEATLAAATKGTRVQRTALDELRERRDAKRGA